MFQITKTPKRSQTGKLIKRNASDARKIRAAKERGRPALLDADIDRAAQETRYELDISEIQRQSWAQWESTGKPDFKKGVAQAFMGFTKRKYGQMKHGKR